MKSIAKKKVSFKAQQEVFRRDSTSSSSGCDDSFDYAEELDNSVLDKDPDFVPTSEIVQAEADVDKTSLEIEESIAAEMILSELNRNLEVVDDLRETKLAEYLSDDRDCQPTQVERELGEEHNQLQNSFCDDELSTDMHRW